MRWEMNSIRRTTNSASHERNATHRVTIQQPRATALPMRGLQDDPSSVTNPTKLWVVKKFLAEVYRAGSFRPTCTIWRT